MGGLHYYLTKNIPCTIDPCFQITSGQLDGRGFSISTNTTCTAIQVNAVSDISIHDLVLDAASLVVDNLADNTTLTISNIVAPRCFSAVQAIRVNSYAPHPYSNVIIQNSEFYENCTVLSSAQGTTLGVYNNTFANMQNSISSAIIYATNIGDMDVNGNTFRNVSVATSVLCSSCIGNFTVSNNVFDGCSFTSSFSQLIYSNYVTGPTIITNNTVLPIL